MKRIILSTVVMFAILALWSGCKIISFEAQPVYVTVTVDEEFHVNETVNPNFDESKLIDLAEVFADIGTDQIESIYVQMVSITFTSAPVINPTTTVTGTLKIGAISSSSTTADTLGSFSGVGIEDVLGICINPYSTAALLDINEEGVTELENMLQEIPRPVIKVYFVGEVSDLPVTFDGTVHLEFLVATKP